LDAYVCAGTELTVCGSYTFGNSCGGCSALAYEPGEICGDCDASVWSCDGTEALVCEEVNCSCDGETPTHWRIFQNSVDTSNWFVAEVELFDVPSGGFDLTSPSQASARASAARNSERSYLAFDDNADPGNSWGLWYVPDMLSEQLCDDGEGGTTICPVPADTDWLAWQFDQGVILERIRIKQFETDSFGGIWGYTSLKVQSSCDGEVWSDEWIMNNLPTDGSWAERSRN